MNAVKHFMDGGSGADRELQANVAFRTTVFFSLPSAFRVAISRCDDRHTHTFPPNEKKIKTIELRLRARARSLIQCVTASIASPRRLTSKVQRKKKNLREN